ncbi:hypothetical protein M9H77_07960 [Catharanthus roseus]|uniref:Uncharacterized protein n=1 Tax=Catharanthus roseus TaxID=4058 RepID=A0ACC0BWL7_CATRO|nr:hypothetical protein M9H77_07960 [Catharanthus roseus]
MEYHWSNSSWQRMEAMRKQEDYQSKLARDIRYHGGSNGVNTYDGSNHGHGNFISRGHDGYGNFTPKRHNGVGNFSSYAKSYWHTSYNYYGGYERVDATYVEHSPYGCYKGFHDCYDFGDHTYYISHVSISRDVCVISFGGGLFLVVPCTSKCLSSHASLEDLLKCSGDKFHHSCNTLGMLDSASFVESKVVEKRREFGSFENFVSTFPYLNLEVLAFVKYKVYPSFSNALVILWKLSFAYHYPFGKNTFPNVSFLVLPFEFGNESFYFYSPFKDVGINPFLEKFSKEWCLPNEVQRRTNKNGLKRCKNDAKRCRKQPTTHGSKENSMDANEAMEARLAATLEQGVEKMVAAPQLPYFKTIGRICLCVSVFTLFCFCVGVASWYNPPKLPLKIKYSQDVTPFLRLSLMFCLKKRRIPKHTKVGI